MRILLTNDDGIHAEGLQALYDLLTDLPNRTLFTDRLLRDAGPYAVIGGPTRKLFWSIGVSETFTGTKPAKQ